MSTPLPDISIFIPCLNEEPHVRGAIERVVEAGQITGVSFEILIFDDGSTDGTAAKVEAYQREHPHVALHLVRNPRSLGIATNFIEGSFRARGRYYRMVNGDDIEPLATHVALFRAIGSADVLLPVYTSIEGRRLGRTVLSKIYTWIVNTLSGNTIGYYNGGPVVLTEDVRRYHVDASGVGFQAEFITRLLAVGRAYRELYLTASDREGSTALTLRNVLSVTHSFVKIGLRALHK